MMTVVEQVRQQALNLSTEDRASLARDLILSLDASEPADAAQTWAEEIEARAEAFERGECEAVDWRDSLARVRQTLAARKRS